MAIITIRGQLGSAAPEIAKAVAASLHIDYVDQQIIAEVAAALRRSKEEVAEKEMPPGTLMGKIVEALARSGAVEANFESRLPLDDQIYFVGLEHVIQELARNESLVIRGRGSQFILRDHPGALHVLLVAPLATRVKRVVETLKVDEETAKKKIAEFDGSRREFTKRYFHADLEDTANYDLVINTARFNPGDIDSIITRAVTVRNLVPGQTTSSRASGI